MVQLNVQPLLANHYQFYRKNDTWAMFWQTNCLCLATCAKHFQVLVIVGEFSDTTLIIFCLLEIRPTYSFTTKKGSSSVMSALNDTHALIVCCNIHTVLLISESSGVLFKVSYRGRNRVEHKITKTTNGYKKRLPYTSNMYFPHLHFTITATY